jgi:hypothetical protein
MSSLPADCAGAASRQEAGIATGGGLRYVVGWFGRWWLAIWFGCITLARLSILDPAHLFLDARLYVAAAHAWMAGVDPWAVNVEGVPFAAPPPGLLFVAPFALLPPGLDLAGLLALIAVAVVASVRILRLPWWWLAFPPLFECMISGQVQAFLLPLMLGGWGWAAVLVKTYAAIPLVILGRSRDIALAIAAAVITIPFLPWAMFLAALGSATATQVEASRAGAGMLLTLLLSPLWIASLALIGRQRAAWLAIALWPSPQPYYATLTMPAAMGIVAAVIAAPFPGAPLAGLIVAGLLELVGRRRAASTALLTR